VKIELSTGTKRKVRLVGLKKPQGGPYQVRRGKGKRLRKNPNVSSTGREKHF